ncbi:MAG: histidine ammonia-lyase [Proteobacteria bacterium]|nr:MAG: histidine ammonia-lyase [Pseudomonadota bacterium]
MPKGEIALQLGRSKLSFADAIGIAMGRKITLAGAAKSRVLRSRKLVEKLAHGNRPIYGLNTGFGAFANRRVDRKDLRAMQSNVIRSHAGGSGAPLLDEEVRLAMGLRLNALLRGNSGVRYQLCLAIHSLIKAEIYPLVPESGSVGASGDLIPLAHIGLGLMGEGKVRHRGKVVPAHAALRAARIKPYEFQEKEGISFINGTEIMQAVGGLALSKILQLEQAALRIGTLTFEALQGRVAALDGRLHRLRNQPGQVQIAKAMLQELRGSSLLSKRSSNGRVQDSYSLRCMPQVHGACRDALSHVRQVIEAEFNALTDNPVVFPESGEIVSGGNFHGEVLALNFDFAAMAASELAAISERRLELLCNPNFSSLPAFLTEHGGLESGYMVLQYLSASLVNENKVLSHPACTDSIPGNVGIEDFVSMGMTSAKKLKRIAANLETVIAAELLAAAQAIDLRGRPKLGKGSAETYALLRRRVKPLKHDRVVADDIERAREVVCYL